MAVLGVASITPAFPQVIKQFGITGGEVGLLITVFTLPGVFLAPVTGIIADRFGRKTVLVPSLLLFAAAGFACVFVRDFHLLLVMRSLQGVGGASLGSMNTTIIGDLFSGRRRAEAMGLNASVLSIAAVVYPSMGGAFAVFGWYYPFAIPVLGLPIGLLALAFLKSPEPISRQNLKDYLCSTLVYMKNIRVVGLFLAGIVTVVILYGAYLTYFSLLLDMSFGASSLVIGILFSVAPLSTAVVSSQFGKIISRMSLETIIKFTFVIYAIALVLMPLMPNLWWMPVPLIIFGIAHGANVPGIHTALAGMAPLENRAAFMSLNSMVLRIGQTIAPLLMALLYVHNGLDATFFGAAIFAMFAPIVAFLFNRIKISRPKGNESP